jgi:hypothetical protein
MDRGMPPTVAASAPFVLIALSVMLLLSGCSPSAAGQVSRPLVVPSTANPSEAATSGAVAVQQPVPPETNPPGDIPDNQAFVAYTAAGGFSVKVPEGWSRKETATGAEFTDKLNTIRLAWTPASAAPTVASVKSVDVPKLTSSEAAFELVSVKAVTLPAGTAVLTVYRENSAANAVTGKQYRLDVERYTVFRSGTRVDLILLSPVGSDNVDPWRIVSRSLTWK